MGRCGVRRYNLQTLRHGPEMLWHTSRCHDQRRTCCAEIHHQLLCALIITISGHHFALISKFILVILLGYILVHFQMGEIFFLRCRRFLAFPPLTPLIIDHTFYTSTRHCHTSHPSHNHVAPVQCINSSLKGKVKMPKLGPHSNPMLSYAHHTVLVCKVC